MDSYFVDLNASIVMRAMREANFYASFPEYNEDIVKEKFHMHFNGNENINFLDEKYNENKLNYIKASLLVFIENLKNEVHGENSKKFNFDNFFKLARFSAELERLIIKNKKIYEEENNGIKYIPKKYADDIDNVKLSYFIKNLPLFPTDDYAKIFNKINLFKSYKLFVNIYYYEKDDAISTWRDLQSICVSWISEQITLGYGSYPRKNPNFSFRKTWKSLKSANILLWCAFIFGVDKNIIEKADKEGWTEDQNNYKAVRDMIDFDMMLDCVSNNKICVPQKSLGFDCFRS